ncbi:hypothetical protein PoB_005278000 [Plakobranchus ocellatus]|uniref:Uncharacterized protein n=1 Tax=Plakobranchus ocellatus TaxID=259542 RepID=A0AAV4C0U3_9GAST|nr:hypothetical protein PoB_005278000 [Plakobranchus ocellatus]
MCSSPDTQSAAGNQSDRSGSNQLFTGLRRVPIDFRLTLNSPQDLVSAMASLDESSRRRGGGGGRESSLDDEALDPERESGVDTSKVMPQPPPLQRRRSADDARAKMIQVFRKEHSLVDLQKLREHYLRVACWEGTPDPEVVFRILEFYPEIGKPSLP